MSKKDAAEPLPLRLGDETFQFPTTSEFEFALAGRTGLPASKLGFLADLSDHALLREAEGIRAVEERFSRTLSGSIEDTTNIGAFLLGLDLSLVSKDHQWRDIIAALNKLDSTYDEFKKIALVKYMQYLTSRQEVVRAFYSKRRRAKRIADSPVYANGSAIGNARNKETVLFDLTAYGRPDRGTDAYDRLPKGETIEIPVEADEAISLLLAKHKYQIVADEQLKLVDDSGHGAILRSGKNIVGRDTSADVTLDSGRRDISRKHLIIETDGAHVVRLTDISSLGTFIPPQYLDKTGT